MLFYCVLYSIKLRPVKDNMMDFASVREEADEYLTKVNWTISKFDSSKKQIHVSNQEDQLSFYFSCPEENGDWVNQLYTDFSFSVLKVFFYYLL